MLNQYMVFIMFPNTLFCSKLVLFLSLLKYNCILNIFHFTNDILNTPKKCNVEKPPCSKKVLFICCLEFFSRTVCVLKSWFMSLLFRERLFVVPFICGGFICGPCTVSFSLRLVCGVFLLIKWTCSY
jgi:hypothetical protein